MGEFVRVESVDALKRFRVALCQLVEVVSAGLDEAEAEIQRTAFWVQNEQSDYWKRQAAKWAENCVRAKSALSQKRTQLTALGSRYSCVDEEKALAAAERKVEEARQKQINVRRWRRLLDEEGFSYQGLSQGLRVMLQGDIPNALAQLDNMIASLEAYAAAAGPEEQRSVAPAATGADFRRPEDLPSMARGTPAAPIADARDYRKLRARTPSVAVREATPVSQSEFARASEVPTGSEVHAALAGCDLARSAVAPDDKIVLARGVWRSPRVYLERAAGVAAGDSGWYIGFADDRQVAAYDGARVADVLAARPDWAPVLELPAGCLAVFDGAALAALLDPQDAWLAPRDDRDSP
jgi:hypothetical protein